MTPEKPGIPTERAARESKDPPPGRPSHSRWGSFDSPVGRPRSRRQTTRAPKGRQKLAWGVSPRNATTPLVSALKGRQISAPAARGTVIGQRRRSGSESRAPSPEGAAEISLGREPQDRPDPSLFSPEGAAEFGLLLSGSGSGSGSKRAPKGRSGHASSPTARPLTPRDWPSSSP